ncbi:hypothetical protein ACLBKU_01125 [Erythrobacter sp. NE805]|uniref:hypothetical protein n=1 Tax=Erythrobacter sp. NE805 TaxID=3389875 RepID=UPI00396B3363
MTRLPSRPAPHTPGQAPRPQRRRRLRQGLAKSCALAAALLLPEGLAAQQSSGTFSLPPGPTQAPAGPADERAGVAIPPRPVPTARPTSTPSAAPAPAPTIAPRPVIDTAPAPLPPRAAPALAPTRESPPQAGASAPSPADPLPAPTLEAAPSPAASGAAPLPLPAPADSRETAPVRILPALPGWWPFAAGGLGALALLGGLVALVRRRKPKVLRLAEPSVVEESEALPDLADLHLGLEVTGATRSLMMFTLGYRLTIANRSGRAVGNLVTGVQLVCARASAAATGSNGPSAGAAQALGAIERIGPHQARSIMGEVQLPLSAIRPLRQGTKPVFVPLVHVTLEGEGQSAITRSFVIGPRSPSGRVHPIPLDQGPGGIAGLVAQGIAVPPASAAA